MKWPMPWMMPETRPPLWKGSEKTVTEEFKWKKERAEERHKDALEILVSKMDGTTTSDLEKVTPTMFKGKPGEDPEVHALRVKDWFDFTSTTYMEGRIDWDGVKKAFLKRLSYQGRSNKTFIPKLEIPGIQS